MNSQLGESVSIENIVVCHNFAQISLMRIVADNRNAYTSRGVVIGHILATYLCAKSSVFFSRPIS